MGHIYFEQPEMPVPPEAKSAGNRVCVYVDNGGGVLQREYIGVWARKGYTFYPNETARHLFPEYFEKYYGEKTEQHFLGIGLYALTLMIGHSTNLYPILYKVFNPLYGNAIVDYAMYSIKERSNAAFLFKPAMASEVIFSKDRYDDDWLRPVFTEQITNNKIYEFRDKWVLQCKESLKVKKVWIAADGSNSNHQVKNSKYSNRGKAKSKKNVDIASYIWALNATDGTPVTFFLNEGGTSDSKAFVEICEYLKMFDIEIEGFILDRGFLTHEVLTLITSLGYDYLIKLKSDTYAHTQMFTKHANDIYWKVKYLVGYGGIYGIMEGPQKIFSNHPDSAYIGLFFDGKNGSERKVALSDKIFQAMEEAQEAINAGQKPVISKEMRHFLDVKKIVVSEVIDSSSSPESGSKTPQSKEESSISEANKESVDSTSIAGEKTTAESTAAKEEASSPETGSKTLQSKEESSISEANKESVDSTSIAGEKTTTEAIVAKETSEKEESSESVPENANSEKQEEAPRQTVRYEVVPKEKYTDERVFSKGFDSLACSKELSAREMHETYSIRDVCEKQFMIDKTMMGYHVFRGHSDSVTLTRELICFIAAIIRNNYEKTCEKVNIKKPTKLLEELEDKAYILLKPNGSYRFIDKRTENMRILFNAYGLSKEDFVTLAGDVTYRQRTKRSGGAVSQYHIKPADIRIVNECMKKGKPIPNELLGIPMNSNEQENEDVEKNENVPESKQTAPPEKKEIILETQNVSHKRGRGRPAGRKNNKTLEREAKDKEEGIEPQPKRSRGRQVGSKNRKTIEREAAAALLPPPEPKKRGRRKGSKDSKPRKRRTKAEIAAGK